MRCVDQERRLGIRSRDAVGQRATESQDQEQLRHGRSFCARDGEESLNLFYRVEPRRALRFGLEFGGLRFDQLYDMIDHVGVLHVVVGHAR